jgi:hypothetical protein
MRAVAVVPVAVAAPRPVLVGGVTAELACNPQLQGQHGFMLVVAEEAQTVAVTLPVRAVQALVVLAGTAVQVLPLRPLIVGVVVAAAVVLTVLAVLAQPVS